MSVLVMILFAGLVILLAGLAAWSLAPQHGTGVTDGDDPWSVPASWTVVESDISFESDGFRLSGTLYSPEGVRNGPALVAVQQAETDTRDNSLMVQMAQSLNAIGYGNLSHDSATALLAEVENEPWFELAWVPASDDLPEDPESSSWILEMDYDPVPAYEGVEAPMLFMLGGEDLDIPVQRTLEIAEILDGRDGREIVVVPGASHIMRIEENPADQFDLEASDASNSTMYFIVMGEWLGRLGL